DPRRGRRPGRMARAVQVSSRCPVTFRLVLTVTLVAAVGRAQEPPADLDTVEETPQPPTAEDRLGIGIDILRGLANLGNLASCRSLPYDAGDPAFAGFVRQGRPIHDRAA